MTAAPTRQRVLSGMRPTGPLHLGHYLGALKNWVTMQDTHDCFFMSADLHALSTSYDDTGGVRAARRVNLAEWIACGVDPARAVVFEQSRVAEHSELHVILSMITPLSWLERVPTYKEQQENLSHKDLSTYGFLGYPLLQSADIILYRAHAVPVGQDQLPHLELTRELVRRFHHLYSCQVFPEPEAILSPVPKLSGLDGRKMSKSYNNALMLGDSKEDVKKKVLAAPTDPQRIKRTDPGNPEVCNIYAWHKALSALPVVEEVAAGCRSAGIGCVDCKKKLLVAMDAILDPVREKRAELVNNTALDDILVEGNRRARTVAHETMEMVRDAVKL
ncbi:MAG: tryptophan--tRNA ligase [Deltaproteobacteria bacterium]|nr:tryptophan--tRNA ligase [Deltaproteobacteria bacterium]